MEVENDKLLRASGKKICNSIYHEKLTFSWNECSTILEPLGNEKRFRTNKEGSRLQFQILWKFDFQIGVEEYCDELKKKGLSYYFRVSFTYI